MATSPNTINFNENGAGSAGYTFTLTATATAVTGGTKITVSAIATKIRTDITPAYSSNGTRSFSIPGSFQNSNFTTGGSTGSASWTYDFRTSNTQTIWSSFDRYLPYSAGTSVDVSMTVAGSGSSYLLSTTNTVTVPLFSEPAPTTYSLTFNGNGNTGGSVPNTVTGNASGSTYTLPGNTGSLTKTGYNFLGWNTSSTATTTQSSVTFASSNITVYAVWEAIPVGPQSAGSQKRVYIPENFTNTLKNTGLYVSTNGYVQIGGTPSSSTSISGSGYVVAPLGGDLRQTALYSYDDGSSYYIRWQGAYYNNATETVDYQVKFYYNSTAVDVYFVTNNLSSITPSNSAVLNYGSTTYSWSTATNQTSSLLSTGSMTRNTSQDGVDDSYTTLISPPLYSVYFYPNNGTFSDSSTSMKTVTQSSAGAAVTAPSISRTGYSFNGWWTSTSGGSIVISSNGGSYTPSSNTSLYAQWIQSLPVFSDQSITNTGLLNKNINTNADFTVSASPVQSYAIESYGSGLNPTWLSINSAGQLSGVPTALGSYTFRIKASNGTGNDTYSNELAITIYPPGERFNSISSTVPLTIAKRFIGVGQPGADSNGWVNVSIMKRFIGIGQPGADSNGWINISN